MANAYDTFINNNLDNWFETEVDNGVKSLLALCGMDDGGTAGLGFTLLNAHYYLGDALMIKFLNTIHVKDDQFGQDYTDSPSATVTQLLADIPVYRERLFNAPTNQSDPVSAPVPYVPNGINGDFFLNNLNNNDRESDRMFNMIIGIINAIGFNQPEDFPLTTNQRALDRQWGPKLEHLKLMYKPNEDRPIDIPLSPSYDFLDTAFFIPLINQYEGAGSQLNNLIY